MSNNLVSRASFRVTIVLFLGVVAISLIHGCSRREEPRDVVLYVTLTLGNPFYQEMIGGLRDALSATPTWQLDTRAGQRPEDVSGQRDIIESVLTDHIQERIRLRGLVLVPASSGAELTSAIKAYNDAGIPVINVDIPIEETALQSSGVRLASFVGSNNVEGGRRAADEMATQLPNGGTILVLMGAPGSVNARDRFAGFSERIQAIGRERKVSYQLRQWTANWNMSEALTAVDTILSSGDRLDGIFAENDLMALGAAEAIKTQSRPVKSPVVVGYDAIPDAVRAVKDGAIFSTISQNPGEMGKVAIQYLQEISNGRDVPARTIVPVTPITK